MNIMWARIWKKQKREQFVFIECGCGLRCAKTCEHRKWNGSEWLTKETGYSMSCLKEAVLVKSPDAVFYLPPPCHLFLLLRASSLYVLMSYIIAKAQLMHISFQCDRLCNNKMNEKRGMKCIYAFFTSGFRWLFSVNLSMCVCVWKNKSFFHVLARFCFVSFRKWTGKSM